MKTEIISVIIPVLNEANTISSLLERLVDTDNVEIIVVDGGSQDETVTVARSHNVQVISTPPGRACQMNVGAARATGDILLFLHADTRLPVNFDSLVRQGLKEPKTIAGAFELRIDAQQFGLRLIERLVNWRSRFFSMPYGDQAIFLKATIFHDIGGFPNLPIMEDFEFFYRMKKFKVPYKIVKNDLVVSSRKYEKNSYLRVNLSNLLLLTLFKLKVSPERIRSLHYRLLDVSR